MILKQALSQTREILAANSIEDASLEGELLLRHLLQMDRVQLYLDFNLELNPQNEESLWQLVKRRLNGEPSAYITGHREFYGLDFSVDDNTLIPRPESELLVEKAISLAQDYAIATVAEIGTGCGAIAISLALNLPEVKIVATDISALALSVARCNCQKHGVADRICLLEGDLLEPLLEPVDLIVANLPYVKESELPLSTAGFEPVLALNGGPDGLEMIYRLCREAHGKLSPCGCLLLEIGQGQREAINTFLRDLFPSVEIEVTKDFNSIERVVSLRLT